MNKKLLILLCLFVLSRIFFINPLPVFFDSQEYLNRFADPNLYRAIVTGHFPFHLSYVSLFWSIFHFAVFFKINPSFMVVFSQIAISTFAIYCFYRFIEIITNKETAFLTMILAASFPLYWITNVSIMTESTYVNFFLISLYFFALYCKTNYSRFYLALGCILFGLSILNNPVIVFWTPFLLSVIYFLKKERVAEALAGLIISFVSAVLIDSFFVTHSMRIPFMDGLRMYLFNDDLSSSPNVSQLLVVIRFVRNALFPIIQNNTIIVLILSLISLVKVFKLNKKLFIVTILWILPLPIVNQWFNPLIAGRHGIITEFGFAFLIAILLKNKKIWFVILTTYLLIVFLPGLLLLKEPIPDLTERSSIQSLPTGLLIESHFARPQIQGHYLGRVIYVNEQEPSKESTTETINRYLKDEKPVFVTSQALSDPYGLYSGPYLNLISLSYVGRYTLYDIITLYSVKKYETIDADRGLLIYKINSQKKSAYPNIPILIFSRNTLNYFDPIYQLYLFSLQRLKLTKIYGLIK